MDAEQTESAEQARAHDRNFVVAIELLARVSKAGFTQAFGEVRVAATGLPVGPFNAVFVTAPLARGSVDLANAVERMRREGLPFVVHVRADLPAAIDAARGLGLSADELMPCFAIGPSSVPAPPAELRMRRVNRRSFEPFLAVTADGFDMPQELAAALYPRSLLDQPGVRAYLGSVDGRPVATAVSVRTGDAVGIYSVATVGNARGHGYGTAMTWRTLTDAAPNWRVGVLQATPMGRPIYERMGFRLVREYLEFTDTQESASADRYGSASADRSMSLSGSPCSGPARSRRTLGTASMPMVTARLSAPASSRLGPTPISSESGPIRA